MHVHFHVFFGALSLAYKAYNVQLVVRFADGISIFSIEKLLSFMSKNITCNLFNILLHMSQPIFLFHSLLSPFNFGYIFIGIGNTAIGGNYSTATTITTTGRIIASYLELWAASNKTESFSVALMESKFEKIDCMSQQTAYWLQYRWNICKFAWAYRDILGRFFECLS